MKKAVITVLGQDQVGIIARVCFDMADNGINILDISQTIVGGYFNMVMVVDMTDATTSFETVAEQLDAIGEDMGLKVKLQDAKIFDAMYRV